MKENELRTRLARYRQPINLIHTNAPLVSLGNLPVRCLDGEATVQPA